MLWKLTGYELKKTVGNKFFFIALVFLLVLNILLSCGIRQYQGRLSNVNPDDLNEEGRILYAESQRQSYWEFTRGSREHDPGSYTQFAEMTGKERQNFEDAMKEKYGDDVFGPFLMPTDKMMAVPGYFEGKSDYTSIWDYKSWLDSNREIEDARQAVIRSAQSLGREAVIGGDDYGIRRNLRILDLYETPRKTVVYPINGWQNLLENFAPVILACLMVFLACSGSFTTERENKTWFLLQTSRNGKGKVFLAKYLAGIITALGLTLLFQIAAVGATLFYRSFYGGSTPVAALEELRYCPYLWDVAQYAAVTLLCQLFGVVLLSVLLNTISAVSKNGIISYGSGAVLLGGSLALSFFPPKAELLSGPLALIQPQRFFTSYYTANVFTFPIPWVVAQAALWSILSLGGMFLAWKLYGRKRGAV